MIFNNDILDLVKCAENTVIAESKTVPLASFVHNPYGDFSIEFLNRYIKDFILLPKGQSQSLKERLCWWDLVRMSAPGLEKLESQS